MGVFIYYLLSRHLPSLPYAAIVFLLGFSIGYTTTSASRDATTQSASIWLQINGQLILLIFLPGLIFLDSITTNVFLFFQAFWQLVTFAFPMVMGGTFLTALVAMYVFPYGWSFNLCMTFGAILSGEIAALRHYPKYCLSYEFAIVACLINWLTDLSFCSGAIVCLNRI